MDLRSGNSVNYSLTPAATIATWRLATTTTQFPRGSVDLHACRLFPTEKLCTSESIVRAANSPLPHHHHPPLFPHPSNILPPPPPQVTKYTNKIEATGSAGLTPTDVGTYNTANTAFTDAFTGHYDSGSGRTSIAPKSSDCKQAPHRIMHRTMHRARTAQSHALRLLRPLRTPTRCAPTPSARRTPS